MTEHVHEWGAHWGDFGPALRCECGALLHESEILKRCNATERLSAERADAIVGALKGEYEIEDVDIDAVQAYADILEGK